MYLTGAVLTGILAFPYFAVLSHGGYALIFIAIVLSLVVHAMQYGPQAALIGESFPTHLRYGGAGIGYQLASVFAGGPAPLLATWLLPDRHAVLNFRVHRPCRGHHRGLRRRPSRSFPREHRRRDCLHPRVKVQYSQILRVVLEPGGSPSMPVSCAACNSGAAAASSAARSPLSGG